MLKALSMFPATTEYCKFSTALPDMLSAVIICSEHRALLLGLSSSYSSRSGSSGKISTGMNLLSLTVVTAVLLIFL